MSVVSSILQPVHNLASYMKSLNGYYLSRSIEELKEMTLMERVSIYNWYFELCCICLMALVFFFYQFGMSINTGRANMLFGELNVYLKDHLNFDRVAFSDKQGNYLPYVEEQQKTWFTSYSTGRSAIASISVRAHLYARSNPVASLIEWALRFFFPSFIVHDIEEFAEIVITPNGVYTASETSQPNNNAKEILNNYRFVSAIVNKSAMNESRSNNFFLSVTRTTESDKLPIEYVFMSEINQFNNLFFHYAKKSFTTEILNKASKFLKFISFTDLPAEKPVTDKEWEAGLIPRVVIRTGFITSKEDLETLKEIVGLMVEIYDNCTRDLIQNSPNSIISADLVKKSVSLRAQELAKIIKAMKQAELELAMEKKLEAEREKRRQLKSTGELSKVDQKMKEKRERRMKNKQKVRM